MVESAGIAHLANRDNISYSLRQYMIMQRIMSGVDFRAIADMCGTSITQIERTYYHLNDTIRLTNTVADYRLDSDGTMRLVWTGWILLARFYSRLGNSHRFRRGHLPTKSVRATSLNTR